MIRKLRINEADETFDKEELWSYLINCIEDTVYALLDSKLSANAIKAEVPGYDKDWCAEELSKADSKKINDIISKLTDIVYDMSMENYKKGSTNESLTEAMKVTNSKTYQTEFGPFVIETHEGKARRRNQSTGKMEWREVKSTGGVFKDYPDAVEYFVTNDHGDRYVSCSQGNNSYAWEDSLGVSTYDEALKLVDAAVVECFQDYYDDKSLY